MSLPPDPSTVWSIAASAEPTYVAVPGLIDHYVTDQVVVFADVTGWYEVNDDGTVSDNPLGTSGPFAVTLEYDKDTQENVVFSSLNISTKTAVVASSGEWNGRGYGTPIFAHTGYAEAPDFPDVFPIFGGVQYLLVQESLAANAEAISAETTRAEGAEGTLTTAVEAAQSTANAALPLAGGTMSGDIDMGGQRVTDMSQAGSAGEAVEYAQWQESVLPIGFQTGVGSPLGVVVPETVNGLYFDTATGNTSTGLWSATAAGDYQSWSSLGGAGNSGLIFYNTGGGQNIAPILSAIGSADVGQPLPVVLAANGEYFGFLAGSGSPVGVVTPTFDLPIIYCDVTTPGLWQSTGAGNTDWVQLATTGYADTAASTAQTNAEAYADSLAPNYDGAGAAAAAQSNAESFATSAANTAQADAEAASDPVGSAAAVQALALLKANNLSDLASLSTAQTNLGLSQSAIVTNRQKFYTADYGITTGDTSKNYGDLLNQLLMTAERYSGTVEISDAGNSRVLPQNSMIYTSQTIWMRNSIAFIGPSGRSATVCGVRRLPTSGTITVNLTASALTFTYSGTVVPPVGQALTLGSATLSAGTATIATVNPALGTGTITISSSGTVSGSGTATCAGLGFQGVQYTNYPGAVSAFNPSSHSYAIGNTCTYAGDYYVCLVAYTSSAVTPNFDPYHWENIGPVGIGTVAASTVVTLNTSSPQSLPLTTLIDVQGRSMFSQWGGVCNLVVSGTTYTITYDGTSGDSLTDVLLTSGTVTTAGGESLHPFSSTGTLIANMVIHGGWSSNAALGDTSHGHNFTSLTEAGSDVVNVTVGSWPGDGFHSPQVFPSGYVDVHLSLINCWSSSNGMSGVLGWSDSNATALEVGYCGLGGVLSSFSSFKVSPDSKIYNIGRVPLFKAASTITASGSGTTITTTSALTVDHIRQGLFDGSTPGGGTYFAANTYVTNITLAAGTYTLTLSKAITGTMTNVTVNIGGYYWWPISTGNAYYGGAIGSDGKFYTLKVASLYGSSTDPSSDSTNWQPVRTAYEWGFGFAEFTRPGSFSGTENYFAGAVEAVPRGIYACYSTIPTGRVDVVSNGWNTNPLTGSASQGTLFGVPAAVTNLAKPAAFSFPVASTTKTITGSVTNFSGGVGTLVDLTGAPTNIDISLTSDATYATSVAGTMGLGCIVKLNGAILQGSATQPGLPMVSGIWYPGLGGYSGTPLLTTANYGYATPLIVTSQHTFSTIGCDSTAGGSGGTPVMRFAIFADNGAGYPGALIVDCGTAAVTGTGGIQVGSLARALAPGLYWLVASPQGATVTQPTCRVSTNPLVPLGYSGSAGGSTYAGYTSSATGSFPTGSSMASPFPASASLGQPVLTMLQA